MPYRETSASLWAQLVALKPPKTHLIAAGSVALVVAALVQLVPAGPRAAERNTVAVELSQGLPPAGAAARSVDPASPAAVEPFAAGQTADSALPDASVAVGARAADRAEGDRLGASLKPAVTPQPAVSKWREDIIRAGDNLTSVFKRLGLSDNHVYAVANGCKESKELTNLQPGETISALLDDQGNLAQLRYVRSPVESYVYEASDTGFDGEKLVLVPDKGTTFRQGTIDRSLSADAGKAGLSQEKILALANIFAWDIDFARDIKSGDRFSVLYEEHFVGDQAIGSGDILAAEFVNRGKTYRAVRYVARDGAVNYYTPDGRPMRKAFLRAPLDFMRISSNFNMRRFHPILKLTRPHRGVDYSAPRGTPVYAAGSGVVVESGFSGPNGNYVVIKHNSTYTTKYLHLNNRMVKRGQAVKQGATIGKVGATGYATGPHLHYEFLIKGVHQDPRSAKMPISEPIPKALQKQFAAQTGPLLTKLASLETVRVAAASTATTANID